MVSKQLISTQTAAGGKRLEKAIQPGPKLAVKDKTNALDQDQVTLSEPGDADAMARRKRKKAALGLGATVIAAVDSVLAIPQSLQVGLDTANGVNEEITKTRVFKWNVATNAVAGLVAGAALGPLGMAVGLTTIAGLAPVAAVGGLFAGLLKGTIEAHLSAKSGANDSYVKKTRERIEERLEGDEDPSKLKTAWVGLSEGVKQAFQSRKETAKIQLSGAMDGIEYLREADKIIKPSAKEPKKMGMFKKTVALLCGVSGVMINAPGGLISGMLESLKDTKTYKQSALARTTLLMATNLGKLMPGAVIGSLVAGPLGGVVGAAVSAGVGIVTNSIPSMVDGRDGINRAIQRPLEHAVNEAHGQGEHRENLRVYYRAGKGGVVGANVGTKEGWKAGYQGGIEMVESFENMTRNVFLGVDDEKEAAAKQAELAEAREADQKAREEAEKAKEEEALKEAALKEAAEKVAEANKEEAVAS